jgi:hypothetical protein
VGKSRDGGGGGGKVRTTIYCLGRPVGYMLALLCRVFEWNSSLILISQDNWGSFYTGRVFIEL